MNTKTVLFVGSSGGIGEAMINALRNSGHQLLTTSSNPAKPETQQHFFLDLTDVDAAANFRDKLVDKTIDKVVINSGIADVELFNQKNAGQIKREYGVNLLGPVTLLNAVYSKLADDAVIVLNSSLNAYLYTPFMSTYCSTKAGLLAFAETLRHESDQKRIITLVTPPVKTAMADRASFELNRHSKAELKQRYIDPNVYAEWVVKKIAGGHNGLLIHPSIKMMLLMNRLFPSMQDKIYKKIFGSSISS